MVTLEKYMPFDPVVAELVASGQATMTARYLKHPFYPKAREEFAAHCDRCPLDGVYYCQGVRKAVLGRIRDLYHQEIGLGLEDEYEDLWCRVTGITHFDPEVRVHLYTFRRL